MQKFVLILCILIVGCAKVPLPTQPEIIEIAPDVGAPLGEQQIAPTVNKEPFQITLEGVDDLPITSAQKLTILRAKLQWEDVIVEGLPDHTTYFAATPPVARTIDDILISVLWEPAPEGERWLGRGGAWYMRPDSTGGLPFYGKITIYDNMLQEDIEVWKIMMLHEIGHVLGFTEDMFKRKVGILEIGGVRYLNGENAALAYRELLYNMGEKLAFGIPYIRAPLDSDAPHHWKYPEMRWDTMHPYISIGSALTSVTIGAMADLGYVVDMTRAQPPASYLTKPAIGRPIFRCDGNALHRVVP